MWRGSVSSGSGVLFDELQQFLNRCQRMDFDADVVEYRSEHLEDLIRRIGVQNEEGPVPVGVDAACSNLAGLHDLLELPTVDLPELHQRLAVGTKEGICRYVVNENEKSVDHEVTLLLPPLPQRVSFSALRVWCLLPKPSASHKWRICWNFPGEVGRPLFLDGGNR
jgi:hypothetical protein